MATQQKCALLTSSESSESSEITSPTRPILLINEEIFSDGQAAVTVKLCPKMDGDNGSLGGFGGFGGLYTTDDPWMNDIRNWSDGN